MKRKLSILMAFILVLSFSVTAFAEDSTEDQEAETDGELLYELGIIRGNVNGQLNENKKITREEMIVILNRLSDTKDEDDEFVPPEVPTFSDVPTTHWAYRDIELAYSKGLTSGIDKGEFGIGREINNNQATLFLIRSLGFDTSYIRYFKAADEIRDKFKFSLEDVKDGEDPLERGEVFELMSKALEELTADGKTKKINKLGFDEEKIEKFLNGRGNTKDYKTGEVRDARRFKNYLSQLNRHLEQIKLLDTEEGNALLESIDLDSIETIDDIKLVLQEVREFLDDNEDGLDVVKEKLKNAEKIKRLLAKIEKFKEKYNDNEMIVDFETYVLELIESGEDIDFDALEEKLDVIEEKIEKLIDDLEDKQEKIKELKEKIKDKKQANDDAEEDDE